MSEQRTSVERELKFSTPAERPPERDELVAAMRTAGFELGQSSLVHNKDRYFDDARLSLSRAGLALRRRMSEGEIVATLKSKGWVDGALHERDELELPMEGQEWPRPIHDRVAAVTAPVFLQPHTVIETERVSYPVLLEGRTLAVVSFDSVTARSQHGSSSVGFEEVEIEANGRAGADRLDEIAEALSTLVQLVPNSASKLERVRELLALGQWND